MNESVLDRFLRYVKIDTQSKDDSDTYPSTAKQYDLLKRLGVFRFMWHVTGRLYPDMKGWKAAWPLISANLDLRKHRKMIEKAGVRMACGFVIRRFHGILFVRAQPAAFFYGLVRPAR